MNGLEEMWQVYPRVHVLLESQSIHQEQVQHRFFFFPLFVSFLFSKNACPSNLQTEKEYRCHGVFGKNVKFKLIHSSADKILRIQSDWGDTSHNYLRACENWEAYH